MKIIKKLIILSMVFYVAFTTVGVKATTNRNAVITTEKQNGYTIETIISEEISFTRASQKSGTKKVNYYNGNTLLWSVSVRGTFNYGGNSASCTASTVSAYSNDSNWKITNSSSWKSGNTAYASANGTRYFIGITMETISRTVSLSCSPSGVLS